VRVRVTAIPDVQKLVDDIGKMTGMIFSAVELLRTTVTDALRVGYSDPGCSKPGR
jgi:hypothetical protein